MVGAPNNTDKMRYIRKICDLENIQYADTLKKTVSNAHELLLRRLNRCQ